MSLGERSISAVFWGAGGAVLRIVLQMTSQITLARLLGPAEYGVFAVGSVVVSFCMFFADFGLAYGLIQKREVTDEDIRFAFTWQLLVGALVSIGIVALSGPIAQFFNEPRARAVVAVMSLICLATAATGTSMNLLKRKLDFRTQQIGLLVSYAIGFFGVGIPMALSGCGVWSLVAAWIAQAFVMCILFYRGVRHPVRPLYWYADGRSQAAYGLTVLRTNVLNWFVGNVDRIIVGRVLSIRDIGLYSTMYNMIYGPSASILSIVQPVFFSASARVAEGADDDTAHKLARGFVTLIATVSLYLLPVFVSAAVLADDFVLAVYGPAWQEAAAVLRPLALAMPFFIGFGLSTPMLWAQGRPQDEFAKQWPVALGWTVVCWLLAKHGRVEAVGWGVFGLFIARFAVVMHAVTKVAPVRWRTTWHAARGGVLVSVLAAGAAGAADYALRTIGGKPGACVILAVAAAVLAFYACLRLAPGLVVNEVSGLVSGVLSRFPRPLALRLAWMQGAGGRRYE
ncbi:MAG: lipopolysaccharide biosynthesis protein [Burkholderiaceae bacterium]|nr:lipopolysaccharide biosynthesis protein [Burkholderiaceae bacterium]